MVRKLHMNENNNDKKNRKRINESVERPTIDEMREELADFATDTNRGGFDPANTYDWNDETLFDFFMSDGFTATANLEDMVGYFTWNSPTGNGYETSIEYDFNESYGFEHFLEAIREFEEIDNYKLVIDILEQLGFEQTSQYVYVKEFSGTDGYNDGRFRAEWDVSGTIGEGIIEGEGEDLVYAKEFSVNDYNNDFLAFVEEIDYLMK